MIERNIILDEVDPLLLYGVNNSHLQMLRALFPKLRITARGNVVRLCGSEQDLALAEESILKIEHHILEFNTISDDDILNIISSKPTRQVASGTIIYNVSGKPIRAHSTNQQALVDGFAHDDMLFAIGPAGTGKTYLSIALAVKALKEKAVKRIVLSRPAVEAGEKLGFLPGDMKEKIDPYLQPLYDALEDMLPQAKLQDMMDKNIIQIAPLAFMRGRTLSDAVVILDEAQNTTRAQLRMFLTRMGWNSKMIINGDLTQIDLPHAQPSGLKEAIQLLEGIEGIAVVRLDDQDVVRHRLVTRIINAYADAEKQQNQETQE